MLILVPKITSRVQYTFDFVFKEILQLNYTLCSNKEEFKNSNNPNKWNYGIQYLDNIPSLPAHSLLMDDKIEPISHTKIEWEDLVLLFKTEEEFEGISFDIFSSLFYLISRYEEYVPAVHDAHGRYASFQSVTVQYEFIDKAMVNRYVAWIKKWLEKYFPTLIISIPSPTTLFTFDIDHPYYNKGIGLAKHITRSIKNLFSDIEKDPYDNFEFIANQIESLDALFFILCPLEPTKFDHINHRDHPDITQLFQTLASRFQVGIHPSYQSIVQGLIKEESRWLQSKINKKIIHSRFHFLRFTIDNILKSFKNTDIKNDYSMAYGNISGFRASTSFPFYWYDLKGNKKTDVKIYSPCIMDSSFEYHSQEQDKTAHFIAKAKQYIEEIKQYGGIFIPIFHNDIMAKPEWKTVFLETLKTVKNEL